MIIYLDSEYRCHVENDGTMNPIETNAFDGKCKTFIEGYRFIPYGETWIHNGIEFSGEMISPIENYNYLVKAQEQYELDIVQMEDMQNALEILGVNP